jgi:hypothetical protein
MAAFGDFCPKSISTNLNFGYQEVGNLNGIKSPNT